MRLWKWGILVLLFALLIYIGTSSLAMPGADEQVSTIAEKYAREVGAGERPPLINTDKGDLLLFVFAVGGAVAGFWIGYTWRDLFGKPSLIETGGGNPKESVDVQRA